MRMIKIGKIAILLFLMTQWGYAAAVTTTLVDKKIGINESARLKISAKASGFSSLSHFSTPRVPGLTISYNGSSQQMTFINGKFSRSVSLNYIITPHKTGVFTIPPITVTSRGKKLHSESVKLTVTKEAGRRRRKNNRSSFWNRQGFDVRERHATYQPVIEFSHKKAVVGDPVVMRYYILSTVERTSIVYMMRVPEANGFLFRKIKEKKDDKTVTKDGVEYVKTHVATFILISSGSGTFSIGGGIFRIKFYTYPFPETRDVDYEKKEITIEDYPLAGKPGGFKNNTGNFSLKVDYSPDPVAVSHEKKITVIIQGTGNLLTFSRPEVKGPPGLKILPEDGKEEIVLDGDQVKGTKQFFFTCVPENPGSIKLDPVVLHFYDPQKQQYKTITSKKIVFSATGKPRKKKRDTFDSDNNQQFVFNPGYVLGIVLTLGLGITALVLWERKRYKVLVENDTETKQKAPEPVQAIDSGKYLKEMQVAIDVNDCDVFLDAANKLVNGLLKQTAGTDNEKLETIKSSLYSFRFGGGNVSKEEMRRLYEEIEAVV